jgi:hypothetical protein
VALVIEDMQTAEVFGHNSAVQVAVWTPLTTTDAVGRAVALAGSADRCIQFSGVFGGATVVLQGSNHAAPDPDTDTDWFVLSDAQGNAISRTDVGGEQVLELTRWIRPKLTGGGGTTAISARLLMRRG